MRMEKGERPTCRFVTGQMEIDSYVVRICPRSYEPSIEIVGVNISLKCYYHYQNQIHPSLTFTG
jgi:hypothetical protein